MSTADLNKWHVFLRSYKEGCTANERFTIVPLGMMDTNMMIVMVGMHITQLKMVMTLMVIVDGIHV